MRELEARGFEFAEQPSGRSWLSRDAVLLDPDGHRIVIFNAGDNRLNPPWRLP